MSTPQEHDYGDFTEASYRDLVTEAVGYYRFARFDEPEPATDEPVALWRHDVDISVHRAVRLARIEAEAGALTTYFVLLRSLYYNPFTREITTALREIAALGHAIGLHFDPTYYEDGLTAAGYDDAVAGEAHVLAGIAGTAPTAVSFHLFGVLAEPAPSTDLVGGLANAYSQDRRDGYRYVSDSNGVWRFDRLHDVVRTERPPRLHVLTHPEWWTPEPLSPRKRLQRSIDGYAAAMATWYDEITARHGRPNIW